MNLARYDNVEGQAIVAGHPGGYNWSDCGISNSAEGHKDGRALR